MLKHPQSPTIASDPRSGKPRVLGAGCGGLPACQGKVALEPNRERHMLFEKDHRHGSTAKQRRYARFEIAYTFADFGAAFSFIVGSIFFFFETLMTAGTWLFLFGSVLFAAKPSIRLIREIKLAAMGDDDILAKRYQD
ncbi:YrhK family protein [Tritonibacter mobilis]|uniref:YrhK family protein n=1 Tax=Tritonibacter mobilis TaxID=379347 RepID=UPI002AA5CE7F